MVVDHNTSQSVYDETILGFPLDSSRIYFKVMYLQYACLEKLLL